MIQRGYFMDSKKSIVSASVLAIAFVACWLIFGERSKQEVSGNEEDVPARTASLDNVFQNERQGLDIQELHASLECVDSRGMINCGVYEGQSALYYAVLLGSEEEVAKLLRPEILNEHGIAALNAAAGLGDLKIVTLLMHQEAVLESYERLDFDRHPAIQAARFGNTEVLEFFVDQGLDTNQKFADGYQDLFVEAVIQRQVEAVRYLLESGYELNCQLVFPNGRSIGDLIRELGNREIQSLYASRCSNGI